MDKIKLDDIKPNHPFKVPDEYFEQLNADILEKKSALKPVRLWAWSPRMKLATAVSFVMVVAVSVIFTINTNQGDIYDQYLSGVSDEDIVAYLATTDLTELDLLDMVNDEMFIDFENENDVLEDIELDDESLDAIYLEYGITDEFSEI